MQKDDELIDDCQRLCNYQECPHREENEIPDDWLYSTSEVIKKKLPSRCKYFDATTSISVITFEESPRPERKKRAN